MKWKIPKVGYGTWQITNKEECINGVLDAIEAGYTHIDTAAAYQNESFIAEALKKGNIDRKNIFITSKLHAAKKGYEVAKEEFYKTLENLQTDYLDLYLIHAPRPWGDISGIDYMPQNIESWKAFEELYEEGKIKSIGVSNFSIEDLKRLMAETKIKPMVNQIKVHIGHSNTELVEFCQKEGILVEAYSPLATGKIFDYENVQKMAEKYNVSVAQLSIRWCLQKDMLPLPKSVHRDRIFEKIALDFEISKEDMDILSSY
ncbi:MAG TPA: aldo/keto reductase [Acholeplasmataceae bacterium]|nr:aldo/keto reductase [Acholeplasmataceae bacterium]